MVVIIACLQVALHASVMSVAQLVLYVPRMLERVHADQASLEHSVDSKLLQVIVFSVVILTSSLH